MKFPETFKIEGREVGPGCKAFMIAEVAQNHDGSLGLAHAFVDTAAEAGVDAVKFQTHIAEAEATAAEPFRVDFSCQDTSRYAYWKRTEFSRDQWADLAAHAKDRGLIFLSSPFSIEALNLLDEIGVPAWKVASGEVNNPLLLGAMAATGKPILLSTGMSDLDEISAAVEEVRRYGGPFAVLQSTSLYPTPLSKVGLNMLGEFRTAFQCPIGFSDHSGSIFPVLSALALGADLIEIHVTFHRGMFGPDVPVSLTFDDVRLLTASACANYEMGQHPVNKNAMAAELVGMRELFNKSVAAREDLPVGVILRESMLTVKKPGTGIPARDLHKLIGKRLRKPVSAVDLIRWDDLEETR